MFNVRRMKFQPSQYVLRYKKDKIVAEGAGLSFYCYLPHTSIAVLPVGSTDVPFVFELTTFDFQTVTLQGQLVFRIVDFKKTSAMLNYIIKPNGSYESEDPKKLMQRMVNGISVAAKKEVSNMTLAEAVRASERVAEAVLAALKESKEIENLGVDILGLTILDITPNKETARALEAKTREQILKEADDALYERRNAAIEQERKVKENEYNTEISVEQKKRQVQEAQLEARRSVQEKENRIEAEMLKSRKMLEKERHELVRSEAENLKIKADAEAYKQEIMMKTLNTVDKDVIESIANAGMDPAKLIAFAFRKLAENAGRIGQLNITPDLFSEIVKISKTEPIYEESDGQ